MNFILNAACASKPTTPERLPTVQVIGFPFGKVISYFLAALRVWLLPLWRIAFFAAPLMALLLGACGGGGNGSSSGSSANTSSYIIGGSLTGLGSTAVALQNSNGEIAILTSNGSFAFERKLGNGETYNISVQTPPAQQTCSVSAGAGTVSNSDVSNISVTCSSRAYTLGGTLSGLSGGSLVVQNGSDTLTLSANGNFTFATPIASGGTYNLTVLSQPAGQNCSISNGSGAMGNNNVANIAIACDNQSYTVGGIVSGLNGSLVLQNNAANNMTLTGNGSFVFPATVINGGNYQVSILTQPVGQTCTVNSGSGTISASNISDVAINCVNNSYAVGGTLSGSNGTVVLQNNGGDNLTLTSGGNFTFATLVPYGSIYGVSILTQPAGQTCSISNGVGAMSGNAVNNVAVTCSSNAYKLGGSVSGLNGTLTLQNNGGSNLTISANGNFSFAAPIAYGGAYSVTALSMPANQGCSITNGTGTIGTSDVSNIGISCTTNTYSVGGTVFGLTGTVVLQNNAGDNLTLNANGNFTFPTTINNGGSYNVSVLTQPVGQTCVASGSGTISGSNISNVSVNCSAITRSVGGSVSGLNGTLILQNNNGNYLNLTANGSFTFTNQIAYGNNYNVSVYAQPTGQTCSISSGTGTVTNANVSSVSVTCSTNSYTVGGTISGLNGTVILQNNSGNNLSRSSNGSFTFSSSVAYGGSYSVSVLTQPTGQTCTISNGAGTMSNTNIGNVAVVCSTNSYTVGGTVSGLAGSVVLQNNSGDNLSINANGSFLFSASVAYGGNYAVTVLSNPTEQSCSISNGTGTMGAGNVSNVGITCVTHTYTVGGTASGLNGSAVLKNNGTDTLTVSVNGPFTFPVALNNGAAYNVTVQSAPAGQHCFAGNTSGNIAAANISNVTLACGNDQMGGAIQKGVALNLTTVSTLAGTTGVSGSADSVPGPATFTGAKGITTDGTNLYLVGLDDLVRKIVISSGIVTTVAGTANSSTTCFDINWVETPPGCVSANGIGSAAHFDTPKDITTDGTNLYVSDTGNNCSIRKIVIATREVTTLAGVAGSCSTLDSTGTAAAPTSPAQFSYPRGITTDGNHLYVTDSQDHLIRKVDMVTGYTTTIAGFIPDPAVGAADLDGNGTSASFDTPYALTTDGTSLYVGENGATSAIRKINLATLDVTTLVVGTAAGIGSIHSITTDGINLYVTDGVNDVVHKVVIATGAVTVLVGTPGTIGSANGSLATASFGFSAATNFFGPFGITSDGSSLFVVDYDSANVRQIKP